MDCICNNYYNMIQNSLRELISNLAYNRINSNLPSTDDGSYSPNLNLLNRDNNNNGTFDSNFFVNFLFFFLALATLSSFVNFRRRRRFGGNNSSFN